METNTKDLIYHKPSMHVGNGQAVQMKHCFFRGVDSGDSRASRDLTDDVGRVNSLVTGELCPPFPGVSDLVLNFTSHLFPSTDNRKLSGNLVSCSLLYMTRISVCEDDICGCKHGDGQHLAGYKQVNLIKPGCTLLFSKS